MKLEVQKGSYQYPKADTPVFQDVSFSVQDRDVLTILGRNGIGKTTLLKCLTGIYRWNSGQMTLDGKVQPYGSNVSEMSYVPQAHKLSFPYTVEDVVLMGRVRHMGPLSVPSRADREIAQKAMEDAGVADYAGKASTQLSGGQLQLVYIARALASSPKILVMDEPESHLDFKNQFYILELIEKLVEENGISCIINTHYPDHALRIPNKSLMMGEGKFIFGDTGDILTEENMKEYFGVYTKIGSLTVKGKNYNTFSVLDMVDKHPGLS